MIYVIMIYPNFIKSICNFELDKYIAMKSLNWYNNRKSIHFFGFTKLNY